MCLDTTSEIKAGKKSLVHKIEMNIKVYKYANDMLMKTL